MATCGDVFAIFMKEEKESLILIDWSTLSIKQLFIANLKLLIALIKVLKFIQDKKMLSLIFYLKFALKIFLLPSFQVYSTQTWPMTDANKGEKCLDQNFLC